MNWNIAKRSGFSSCAGIFHQRNSVFQNQLAQLWSVHHAFCHCFNQISCFHYFKFISLRSLQTIQGECMGNIQSNRKHVSKFRRRKIVETAANVVSRAFPEKYFQTNDFHPAIFKQITMGTSYFKLYFNISVHSCGFFL